MDKAVFARHGSLLRLPPGFRFHPTDEELVVQYLKRKIHSYPLPASIIPEIIDLKNYDPWDLPGGRKEAKYFFTLRDVKYSSHGRSSRAARSGYWKSEGKEKQVMASWCDQAVGMKKVSVFYRGKPQTRTDWIMHEYHLVPQRNNHSAHNSVVPEKGDWVLCRIFRRKRTAKTENDDYTNLKDLERVRNRNLSPSSSSSSSMDSDSSCVTVLSGDGEEAISAKT